MLKIFKKVENPVPLARKHLKKQKETSKGKTHAAETTWNLY